MIFVVIADLDSSLVHRSLSDSNIIKDHERHTLFGSSADILLKSLP